MNSKAVSAIVMVFAGCMLNNVFLELLVKMDIGIGNLITLVQFVFIALVGLVKTSKFFTVKPQIGMWSYCGLVFFFFVTSVLNNWAFSFNIPVPLHMIFRSGSLIANMILGIIILNLKYTMKKYLSVGMITIGIIICTLMSSTTSKICTDCDNKELPITIDPSKPGEVSFVWWCLGIVILTVALLLSARMGIYQQQVVQKYGKHSEEMLFYTHFLSLPFFAFYAPNLMEHYRIAMDSQPVLLPYINMEMPLIVLYLIGNILTQYKCISSVYVLTAECSSLTLTLVITLRKFFSLIFSIWYFNNDFTLYHWIGTTMVFVGTLLFSDVFSNLPKFSKPQPKPQQQQKKKLKTK